MRTLLKATILIALAQSSLAQDQTIKRIGSIEICGNKTHDAPTLKAQLRRVRESARFTTAIIEWDIEVNLKGFLKERGFVRCNVTFEEVPRIEQDVDIHISVSEGLRYRLGSLDFRGNSHFTKQGMKRIFDLHPGDVVNMKKIKAGLNALQLLYHRDGYMNYSHIPEQTFDEQHETMSLSITIDAGYLYFISYVAFVGCRDQAQEDLLKAEIAKGIIRPAHLFNPVALESETNRLKKTWGVDVRVYTEINEREARVGILFWINPFAKDYAVTI